MDRRPVHARLRVVRRRFGRRILHPPLAIPPAAPSRLRLLRLRLRPVARPVRDLLIVFAIAGAILLLDQALRPLAQARLTGVRIPFLDGRIVLERLDDPATAATVTAFRAHLAVALVGLMAMAGMSRFMGWYGISLLGAFGLILGGAESNHFSMVAYGFVLNWIGYRIDGPVFVVAPADLMQMAGMAIGASAMTLFTLITIGELLPTPPSEVGAPFSDVASGLGVRTAPPPWIHEPWDGDGMIGAR